MMLACFSQLIASTITLQNPEKQYNFQTQKYEYGFFNYKYIYDGKEVYLTYNDFGTYVKLSVNGTDFYPVNRSVGDYNGITVHLSLESVTDDDVYIKYIITNTNEYEARVKLGTFTDISFKGHDGYFNEIKPLSDKKMYSIEHVKTDPTWQKMIMDHRDFKGKYIPPDNFWYGIDYDEKNKYFMKFNRVEDIKELKASDNIRSDPYSSYSWDERTIQGKQAIVLGIRMFFIMKTPFDFIATKKVFSGEMTGNIVAETFGRIYVQGRNYDAYYAINDSNNFQKLLNFRGTANSMDRYGFYLNPPNGAINTKYTMYLQYEENGKTLQSNRIEFNITRSEKPSISLSPGATLGKKFGGNESLPLKFTITSKRSVNVSYEVYRGSVMIYQKLQEFLFGPTNSNGGTYDTNFSLSEIPSGTFTLKVKVINDLGRESDYQQAQFSVESDVYIQNVHFSKNIYEPNGNIELIGWFTETDLQQRVSFKLDVADGKGTSKIEDIKPIGSLQEFRISMQMPSGLTKGVVPCKLTATQDGIDFYSMNISFILTDKPVIHAQLLNGNAQNEYNNSDSLSFSLTATDEGQCKFSYTINGENETLITVSNDHGNIPLTGLSYSGAEQYKLSIVAKDEYNSTSDPHPYSFKILNKPIITNIETKNMSNPEEQINVYVTYNDKDKGKQLYLYVDYGNNVLLLKTLMEVSSGETNQRQEGPFPYPKSGNYNVTFFLTSQKISNDYKSLPPNQISNLYTMPILSTQVPDVTLDVKTGKFYSSSSKIGVEVTVIDEMFGDIHYLIDGREDFEKGTASTTYDAQQNHKNAIIRGEIPIPSWCKYWSNNTAHTLSVYVIDNYGVSSTTRTYEFFVINNPVLSTLNINKQYVLTETNDASDRTIHFSGEFIDNDEGKELSFYVKEGTMDKKLAHTLYSGPRLTTYSFDYEVMTKSKMNLTIELQIESKIRQSSDLGQANSNNLSKIINATRPPFISTHCPTGTYGVNDTIHISFQIEDDTSGILKVLLNSSSIIPDYGYSASNGRTQSITRNITLPYEMPRGDYTLKYYPIDEFGIESVNKNECPIHFKSKPILENVKLSKTKIDNDESVFVTGTLIDYDSGKTIFIMQQIDNQLPLVLGNMTSNGGSQPFNFKARNLVVQSSGMKKIKIYASDTDQPNGHASTNSQSDHSIHNLEFANDPVLTLNVPEKNVLAENEKITVEYKINSDLPGKMMIYTFKSDDPFYDIREYIPYQGNKTGTKDFSFADSGTYFTYFYAYHESDEDVESAVGIVFYVRHAPILGSISTLSTAEPGSTITIKFNDIKPMENKYLWAFVKINGKVYKSEEFEAFNYNWSPYLFDLQLDLVQNEKSLDIVGWIQNTEDYEDTTQKLYKSAESTATVFITKKPDIEIYFPTNDVFGKNDQITIGYKINDESSGMISAYINNEKIKDVPYSSNGADVRSELKFNLGDKANYLTENPTIKIVVEDSHGSYDERTKQIVIRNKPTITSVEIDSEYIYENEYFNARVTFNDYDSSKMLYFHYIINDDNFITTNTKVTSKGSEGQTINVPFRLPSNTRLGSITIEFYCTIEESAFKSETNKNKRSNEFPKSLTVTFKPSLDLTPISGSYTTNSEITLSGMIQCHYAVKFKIIISNRDHKEEIIYIPRNTEKVHFDKKLKLPDMRWGNKEMKVSIIDTVTKLESSIQTLSFTFKHKPVLRNLGTLSKAYQSGQTICITGNLDCKDSKLFYVYAKLGDDAAFRLDDTYQSDGSDGQEPEFYQTFTTKQSGNLSLTVWISDSYDINGGDDLGKSEPIKTYVGISKIPNFTVQWLSSNEYFSRNTSIDFIIKIDDDDDVSLIYWLDNKKVRTEVFEVDNKRLEQRKSFIVPDNLSKEKHFLQLQLIDNYGFRQGSREHSKDFYVIDRPIIEKIGIDASYLLQNEYTNIVGYCNDKDQGKIIYVFVQVGQAQVTEPSYSFSSNGGNYQEFSFGIKMDANEKPGNKMITVWLSSRKDPSLFADKSMFDSDKKYIMTKLTYKPSLTVNPLSKKIYRDGEKIHLTGIVHSNTNVKLNYYIDDNKMNEFGSINVETAPQSFLTDFTIPTDFIYGNYTLYIVGIDSDNMSTGSSVIYFTISNPPRIKSALLESDEIVIGENLTLKCVVRDPDNGNILKLYYKIDDNKEVMYKQFTSTSQEMPLTVTFQVNDEIKVGKHTLHIYVIDQDNETTLPSDFYFTVIAKPHVKNIENTENGNYSSTDDQNRRSKSSSNGLIAGVSIVAIILIVLVVVAVMMFLKSKKPQQAHDDTVSDNDLEDNETQIGNTETTVSVDEIATHDNPLFNSTEIANDNDPFSDDFDEQNP